MTPSFETNAPNGWMGNPRRGAALGRGSIMPEHRTPEALEEAAQAEEGFALAAERDKEARRRMDTLKPQYWQEAAAYHRKAAADLRALIPAAKATAAATPKVTLRRVRLDAGGYDSTGAYWGGGTPLYWAATDDGELDATFRAYDRDAAKAHVRGIIPGATFYR